MNLLSSRRVMASMLTVGLAGSLAFAGPVSARTITGNVSDVSFETISQSCINGISLEIQKQKHKPYQNAQPGNIPAGVISGLTFEALLINDVDITSDEGWNLANSLSVKQSEERGFSQRFTAETDVAGAAKFQKLLPVGLYLIREITPENPHKDHKTSEPFLITLPVGNVTGDAWQCDVVIKTKETPDPAPDPDPTPTPTSPQPPTSTETTTTPLVPTSPITPPPEDISGSTPEKDPSRPSILASTGANVLWLVGGALLAVIAGVFFVLRGRKSNDS